MRRLAAALALGLVIPAGARPAVLERVEVVEDGGPLVRLHVSEPVTPVAHALPAEGNLPARIYLDLPVTALLPAAAPRRGVGPLLRVRLGRFDAGTVRVVLDLATAMPFTVETGTRTVNVRLGPEPAKAERPTPPPPGSPADAAPGPPAPPPVATPPSPPPPVAVLPPPPAEMAKAPEPSDVQAERKALDAEGRSGSAGDRGQGPSSLEALGSATGAASSSSRDCPASRNPA